MSEIPSCAHDEPVWGAQEPEESDETVAARQAYESPKLERVGDWSKETRFVLGVPSSGDTA